MGAADEQVRVDESNDRFVHIVLNRFAKRNAISTQMLQTLSGHLERLGRYAVPPFILLSGKGVFSAGADIGELRADPGGYRDGLGTEFVRASTALRGHPVPVVVAIEGFALGGGLVLALSADFVVMADDAIVAFSEAEVGLVGGGGVITSLVTRQVASRMMMLGERLNADQALALGLATEVAAPGKAIEAAGALCARMADMSLPALIEAKRLLATDVEREQLMERERDANARLLEAGRRPARPTRASDLTKGHKKP